MQRVSGEKRGESAQQRPVKLLEEVLESLSSGGPLLSNLVLQKMSEAGYDEKEAKAAIDLLLFCGTIESTEDENRNVLLHHIQRASSPTEMTIPEAYPLVVSLPSWDKFGLASMLDNLHLRYIPLDEALRKLIDRSKEELIICSPFVDHNGLQPFASNFIEAIRRGTKIRLLTRLSSPKQEKKRVKGLREFLHQFGELASEESIDIRTYHYSDNNRLLSGIHAKFVVADRGICYIGSGEFRINSYTKNLEVGVMLEREFAEYLGILFDYLFGRSVPVRLLEGENETI